MSSTVGDFASSSGCEQLVLEPTYINGGVLDLVLAYVPDVVRVRAGTSAHSAIFIDFELEQPIPSLVYMQEV